MSKRMKALQITAFLSAVSGATLLVAAQGSAPAQAAEDRCWDHPTTSTTTTYRLHGCAYNQYGLSPVPGDGGDTPTTSPVGSGTNGGGGRPSPGPYSS